MDVATLLFTYNRSRHTEQVLNGLKGNTVLPQKLFVFQDGLKEPKEGNDEWNQVSRLIHSIDWCDTEIIVSDHNKGLAASIVSGINYVFERYDAIIVLEDDCVPSCNFINFMVQCFEKYKDYKDVYCVSGYAWPINVKKDLFDVYGCGRISSWGWGTWKDRWKIYKKDYEIIKRFKESEEMSQRYATWGIDLEKILISNVRGTSDSWAVFWALEVIGQNGICINPYQSLIQNIGMDNSGTHCHASRRFDVEMDYVTSIFRLPDKIIISDELKKAYAECYGSYTAVSTFDAHKENVLIYGVSDFFLKYERQINEEFNIIGFIDQYKRGYFAGKKIIKSNEIEKYDYDKIVIMIQPVQICIDVVRMLIKRGIAPMKLIAGLGRYGRYEKCYDNIEITDSGYIEVRRKGITVSVKSVDEFNNVYEVMVNQIYNYYIHNDKKDIVFDVGMNVGDATLYFAANPKIEKVYAYEPFKETYSHAMANIQKNNSITKVSAFQFGISGENSKRKIAFNSNMSCGQSTLKNMRQTAYEKYRKWGLVDDSEEQYEVIEVKDAADVFGPIIAQYTNHNFILKMDCEGEEYRIMNRLAEANMLAKFSLIMLEWHYQGNESILKLLESAGFSYWCEDKASDMGLIYAYKK